MAWYKVSLSHEDIAAGKQMELKTAFIEVFKAHDVPRNAAMLQSRDSSIHEYYFSPGAASIFLLNIASYSGIECPAPARADVKLLVGHSGAEDIAFAKAILRKQ
jgi:hypothetical protein